MPEEIIVKLTSFLLFIPMEHLLQMAPENTLYFFTSMSFEFHFVLLFSLFIGCSKNDIRLVESYPLSHEKVHGTSLWDEGILTKRNFWGTLKFKEFSLNFFLATFHPQTLVSNLWSHYLFWHTV